MYNRFERSLDDKMVECRQFIESLYDILQDEYVLMPSCNKDLSAYLVPKGTESEVSYYGKPIKSFRISDHWNWFSSLVRCSDPDLVQCRNIDIPRGRKREKPGMPTRGIVGAQVAYYGTDGYYHCVFGEKFNRRAKTWNWIDASPIQVAKMVVSV